MPSKAVPVALVSIGDEVLLGQTVNTNAAWLGQSLDSDGCRVVKVITTGDRHDDIRGALDEAGRAAEYVIVTGGLGPTADDITKPAICKHFGCELVIDEETLDRIEAMFVKRGWAMSDRNKAQALVPEGSTVLANSKGTAPGLLLSKDGVSYFFLPGVPFEMKAIYTEQIRPLLLRKSETFRPLHAHFSVYGIGESVLAERLARFESGLPDHITLAYLPSPGLVKLRLSMREVPEDADREAFDGKVAQLREMLGNDLAAEGDGSIEELVGKILAEKGLTLAIAESCTGGLASHLITSVAGSSNYYLGSVTAYANSIKSGIIGVEADIINEHGAVSEEVAGLMAQRVRSLFGSDYGLASTGIAGPTGERPGKPVGTVYLAVASPSGLKVRRFNFGEERWRNIRVSSLVLLDMLRRDLLESR